MKYLKTYEDISTFIDEGSYYFIISKDNKWIMMNHRKPSFNNKDLYLIVITDGLVENYKTFHAFKTQDDANSFIDKNKFKNIYLFESENPYKNPHRMKKTEKDSGLSFDDFGIIEYKMGLIKSRDINNI